MRIRYSPVHKTAPLPISTVTESGHARFVCPVHGERFRGSITAFKPGQPEQVTIFYRCGCEFVRILDRSKVRTP